MYLNSAIHRLYQLIARSDLITTCAVLVRNQLDHIVRYHFSNSFRTCEEAESLFLRTIGPHVNRFVDVGANVGRFTDELLRVAPNTTSGILIDPSASAVDALVKKFHADPRLRIVAAACGEMPGESEFHEEPNAGETSTLVADAVRVPGVRRLVRVTTIDDEVAQQGWNEVDLVKIDAEGYDLHVIKGMRNLLERKSASVIQFEYNTSWRPAGSLFANANALFQRHGYRVMFLNERGLHFVDHRRFGEYFAFSNYVAVHEDKLSMLKPIIR